MSDRLPSSAPSSGASATASSEQRKHTARSITDDMRELQQELASIEVRVTSREADAIDRLRMDLDVSRTETAKARQAATESEQELNRVREAIAQRDLQIKQLQITVAAKDKIIDTIEQGCTELRAEFARVEAAHKAEMQNRDDEVRCRDEMLEVLKAQLEQLRAGIPTQHHVATDDDNADNDDGVPHESAAFQRLDEGSLAQLQREQRPHDDHHHHQTAQRPEAASASHSEKAHQPAAPALSSFFHHHNHHQHHPHYAAPLANTTKRAAPVTRASTRSKSAGAASSVSNRSGSPPSLAPDTIAMLNELWSKLDGEQRAQARALSARQPRSSSAAATSVATTAASRSSRQHQSPMWFGKENAATRVAKPSSNARARTRSGSSKASVPQPLSGRVSRTALGPKRPEWQS